ncbi:MAG TPA: hypothetical protein VJR22_00005 [Candidatus Nitrosotalea sp.]|nr:hypothetical protein [Candidatus Nitrosotalea sp.]
MRLWLVFVLLVVLTMFVQNSSYGIYPSTPMFQIQGQPSLLFTNVYVDPNPLPDKPFKITADIQSQSVNWEALIVQLSAPDGISVMSPVIAKLAFTNEGNTMRATWIVMAGSSGSYPLVITAHSNFPYDNETFSVTVNVGTPHSLVVTGLNIPGSIFPNDNFTVGLELKNAASVADNNIIAQIFVPAGLQLLDNVTRYNSMVGPDQKLEFNWKLRAEDAGAYVVRFNFTSSNAGPSSITGGINVGSTLQPTGGLLSITARPTTLQPNSVAPILFDITNSGVQPIHNLQIVSASGGGYVSTNTPIWVGDLGVHVTKTIPLRIYTLNNNLSLQIPVAVKYDSNEDEFNETYQTELPLGNQPVFKIENVTVAPSLSYPGDTSDKIDVQIFNYGLTADDVYATLHLPSGLAPAWGNATSAYFGRVSTFQTVTASFFVNVDNMAHAGNYPLSLAITSGGKQTTLNVAYIVSPKAEFQLVSEDDSQLYPGATNVPFRITLKNVGAIAAQTITTTLLSGNSVPGVKSDTITSVGNMENIGTILPGQTFVTTFLVDMAPQFVAGDQSATIQMNWSQNSTSTSNAFVQTVMVPYHVDYGPYYLMYYNGIPITYVIVVIFLGIGIGLFIKKRRKRLEMIEMTSLQDMPQNDNVFKHEEIKIFEDISAEKINERRDRAKIVSQSHVNIDDGDGKR